MGTSLLLPAGHREAPVADATPASVARGPASLILNRRRSAWLYLSLTVLLAFVAGAVSGGVTASLVADHSAGASVTTPTASTVVYAAAPAPATLPALIADINRSVVAIDVTSRTPIGSRGQTITSESFGTGFVIAANGLIVTAAHVVEDAVIIGVTMPDGSIARGTVVGQDAEADLAVIRVERTGLIPVVLGNSGRLRAGDLVVAVGNALSLKGGPSATLGIVSATGRTITTGDGMTYSDLIQVDAAINSGDSGGPLVNAAGQVVGVNTAAVKTNAGENIGFAIPIDVAAPILLDLAGIPE